MRQWKAVPGYEGLYVVSNDGQVRSLFRRVVASSGHPRVLNAKMLKPQNHPGGCLQATLSREGKVSSRKIHDLVLRAFVGDPQEGEECRHLNGDPVDNRLENLQWGSAKENARDRILHGSSLRRYEWQAARLTQAELADKYGTTQSNISCIVRRKSWSHV